MTPRDVFISHSSADAELARDLRAILEGAGYSCWMAPDDIVGTETWTEQILGAIANSKAMIVLVSSAANASPHVSREVNLALGRKRAVLPVRIESVPPEGSLEYLLSLVQRVDAFPPPIASHGDRILRRLETIIARPPSTAGTPSTLGTETEAIPTDAPPTLTPESAAPAPSPPDAPAQQAPSKPTRTASDLGPGSVVGGFTIESQLGEGGMATVYRARQEEPRRLVALKVIRADHAANKTYRTRFLEEKETLAALEHPGIVPIYAAGESDGVLYIAMRLVDGPDLQARIKRQGQISLRETVRILEPVADAVDYAHEQGIVHRDLKPSNIILDRDGRPYLTDFGLGKRIEVDTNVSLPGMAVGTLDYMAPEQFTGTADPKLAPAIDLYALACVAFQCLTGRPPFVRDQPEQLMYAHAHEPPPTVRSIKPEFPAVIDEVFAKALAKDPAARFGSARELIEALDAIALASTTGLTKPVVVPGSDTPVVRARRWFGSNTMLAVGGGALVLVVVVALAASSIFGPPGPTGAPTQGAATSQPTTAAVVTTSPTEPPVTAPPVTAPPVTAPPATPIPTVSQVDFPNSFEEELLALQPEPHVDRASCSRYILQSPDALATISCLGPAGASWQAVFTLFPDVDSLDAAYAAWFERVQIQPTTTRCWDYVLSNSSWYFTGTEEVSRGQLGCYPWTQGAFSGIQIVWTYDDALVLGYWLTTDYQTAYTYFSGWVSGTAAILVR
jgi:serine/threonine-protein kinase